MALVDKSLFLYNLSVDQNNSSIDFVNAPGGPTLQANVTFGFYSLTSLMQAIASAMNMADPLNIYTVTADRSFMGGTQNRVTISTSGTHLDLLFLSGPRTASTTAPLIGFAVVDQTGATSYTGTSTAGTTLITDLAGYNWQPPTLWHKNFGAVNVTVNGAKEALTFAIQIFMAVEYKYEPLSKMIAEWNPFMDWIIQQKPFDFTPEVVNFSTFYNVTLEKTAQDGKGLELMFKEMLPQFPFLFQTGQLTFRQVTI